MQPSEVTALCAYIAAAKTSHKFDDMAAKTWAHILAPVPAEDARLVIDDLIAGRQWIEPNDIVQAAKRLRRDRLNRVGFDMLAANADPDDTAAVLAERRALRDAIASGRMGEADIAAYIAGNIPPLTDCPPSWGPGVELVHRDMPSLTRVAKGAAA